MVLFVLFLLVFFSSGVHTNSHTKHFLPLSLSTIISIVCKFLFLPSHFSLLFLVAVWSNNVFSVHNMNFSVYPCDFFRVASTVAASSSSNQQLTVTIFHFLLPTTDKRNWVDFYQTFSMQIFNRNCCARIWRIKNPPEKTERKKKTFQKVFDACSPLNIRTNLKQMQSERERRRWWKTHTQIEPNVTHIQIASIYRDIRTHWKGRASEQKHMQRATLTNKQTNKQERAISLIRHRLSLVRKCIAWNDFV